MRPTSLANRVFAVLALALLGAVACAQSGDCWEPFEVAVNDRFSVFSAAGEKEAKALLALAEDVHDDFTFLVGMPAEANLFGRRTADIFLLRGRPQYLLWVDSILPVYRADEEVLEFYRECPRVLNSDPPVSAAPESGLGARNWVVNSTAHLLLAHYLGPGKRPPAWFTEGFAAWSEMRFTGRTLFFRVTIGDYGDGANAPVIEKQGSTAIWTDVLEPRVRAGSVRRFDRLKGLGLNHLTFHDLCQSWSLVSYLAEEHPAGFGRWLGLMRRSPCLDRGGWERAFRLSFGWTDAEFHQRWVEWVKLTGAVRRLRAKRRR